MLSLYITNITNFDFNYKYYGYNYLIGGLKLIITAFNIIFSSALFLVCIAFLLFRSVNAAIFRRKIAQNRGFSEGIMTGYVYPLMIFVLGLIFIQMLSLILFPSNDEIFIVIRLLLYTASVCIFFNLYANTPPLLAYWFGKSAFFEKNSQKGRISYTDIYNARLSKKIRLPILNNQQLCKISFNVRGKKHFSYPKKYVCKLTAYEISALSEQVDFSSKSTVVSSKAQKIYHFFLPFAIAMISLSLIISVMSCGIFNEIRYSDSEALTAEVKTLSSPKEIAVTDSLYVYFDNIGAVNVYSLSGQFLYSFSVPHSFTLRTDFSADTENAYYRLGNTVYVYQNGICIKEDAYVSDFDSIFASENTVVNGTLYSFNSRGVYACDKLNPSDTRTIISYPVYNLLFSSESAFGICAVMLLLTIILKSVLGYYSNPEYEKNLPTASAPNDEAAQSVTAVTPEIAEATEATGKI